MIGAVTLRPVRVPVAMVSGKKIVEPVEEVLFTAGSQFHQRKPGGRMGERDTQESISLSGHEGVDVFGDVNDLALPSGVDLQALRLHAE